MNFPNLFSKFLKVLLLTVVMFAVVSYGQTTPSLEMAAGAGNPAGTGPTVSNQVITFQQNVNDPADNVFSAFTPTITATFAFSNQQYTTIPSTEISTRTGLSFGGAINNSTATANSAAVFPLMNIISAAPDASFTSRQSGTAGSGIATLSNSAVQVFTSAKPQFAAGTASNGRYYYGDLTITFNRPVSNPMIQIVGLGGVSGGSATFGLTTELELNAASAALVTLSKKSGSTELSVTPSKILNGAATFSSTTGSGAASGTVIASGTNITSITFQIYLKGNAAAGGTWGSATTHPGDQWLIGVSMARPVTPVSGNVFNDPDGGNVNNSSGSANTVPSGLFANLIDGNNKVVAATAVATDGTYSFSAIFEGTYTMVLSTTQGTQGATAPAASLPSGWFNRGEFNGTPNTGTDSTVNGISAAFSVATTSVTNINFGISQLPDLTLAKSHSGSFTVGSTGAYSFTVTNSGTLSTSGAITVSDTLPTGLTIADGTFTPGGTNGADWSCSAASNVITCTRAAARPAIAVSGTSVFSFSVNVGVGTAVGTNSITNTASVSGGGEINTSNNSASDPTTVLSPNLTIAKSHSGSFTVGSTGTYSFNVGNTGTASTSGTITVVDTLPSGLTRADGTFTPGGTNGANWSCTAASNVITCTSTTAIATSGSSVFDFSVNVGVGTAVGTNSITNSANISGGGEATANNTNNSSSDPTTVLSPNLTIAKSHTGSFTRGSTGTYTLTVGNSGTAATSGTITVSDTLPTGLSVADGTITTGGTNAANWSCTAASNVITCTSTTAIATSGSSVFSFTVNVSSSAASSVTNTATVSGGGEATANNTNNSSSDPTNTVSSAPTVTLVKSCPSPAGCTTTPQNPGTDLTYRIDFTNSGGQGAANMVIVDGIPANTDFKLGSATFTVPSGITMVVEYSNDYLTATPASATWTYTPTSGGGGAAAGYDRDVKAVRWRVTSGTISNVSPGNTGNVQFITKIR